MCFNDSIFTYLSSPWESGNFREFMGNLYICEKCIYFSMASFPGFLYQKIMCFGKDKFNLFYFCLENNRIFAKMY